MKELIIKLNNDLRNEWTHLTFYLHSAALVQGLHATEYKELLQKEANKELLHVGQFSDMLIGLGLPADQLAKEPFYEKVPSLTDPISLGTIGMAASGASGAAGIFGSLFGGSAKSDAYKYQSSMAWQNAAIARQNEKYAFDVGEQQAEKAGIAGAAQAGQI